MTHGYYEDRGMFILDTGQAPPEGTAHHDGPMPVSETLQSKLPVDVLAIAEQAKDFDDFKALLRAANERG